MLTKIASFAIATLAVLTAAVLQAPASVFFSDDAPRISVRYDDLNLQTAAGALAMQARIEAAARAACGPRPTDTLSFGRSWDACVRQTSNRALVDLGAPAVGPPG